LLAHGPITSGTGHHAENFVVFIPSGRKEGRVSAGTALPSHGSSCAPCALCFLQLEDGLHIIHTLRKVDIGTLKFCNLRPQVIATGQSLGGGDVSGTSVSPAIFPLPF